MRGWMHGALWGWCPMSSDYRRRQRANGAQNAMWQLAIPVLEAALEARVVAVVGVEADGSLFILPLPAVALSTMRALAEADWPSMVRVAEEMTS